MAAKPILLPTTALATLLAVLAPPTAAQKTPFKREVDGMIRFFRGTARESGALGDGTCRMTAKVLAAMGHCHRLYSLDDGPTVRNPLNFVITCRQSDGSFADANSDAETATPAATTAWVLDAMRSLAPERFAAEIAAGEKWLATKRAKRSAFAAVARDAVSVAAAARSLGRGPVMADGKPDLNATVDALLTLVAAQHGPRALDATQKATWSEVQQKGFDFLFARQDKGKFYMMIPVGKPGEAKSYMKHYDVGFTGIGLASLMTKPQAIRTPKEQRAIGLGLAWIAESQNDMGGFGRENVNYTTCAAVMAMAKASDDKYKPMLAKAQRFLKALQSVESRGYAPSDRDYGSIGYGGDERGDLSNTQFAAQALKETGLDPQDEAWAKAIIFLQRTQNLQGGWSGKTRDAKTGEPIKVLTGNDGGSSYYPGNSPAGYIELPDGSKIPRSYGSMTYALLKTYTLCGVEKNDARVIAAVKWIEKNFDVDVNPGADPRLGEKARYQGLFYYYMVMAQALAVTGIETLTVPDKGSESGSTKVDWRAALKAKLASLQNESGGWLNSKNGRWWEESDLVCTTYAMLALEHCK
jgi:squalene-hopene/tetraprenyl-beta-curcumene cyclase